MPALRLALILTVVAFVSACGGTTGTTGSSPSSSVVADPDVEAALQSWRSARYAQAADAAERALTRQDLTSRQRAGLETIRGASHVILGRFEEGHRFLEAAVSAHPELGFAQGYRAEALYGLRRYRHSVEAANLAIRHSPQWSRPYLIRAMSYSRLREDSAAIADMSTVIAMAPQVSAYRAFRAVLYETTGRPDLAVVDYREALRLDPGNGLAREGLTRALGTAARRGNPGQRPDMPLPRPRNDAPIIRL